MENEWLRKKMPDFYSYYFLKFAYANSYTRMHEIFLSEIENLAKEKDAYYVKDANGKYYSKKPLPLKVAREQMLALHIHTGH